MPSSAVCFTHDANHFFVLSLQIEPEVVFECNDRRIYIVDVHGHKKDIVVSLDVGVAWRPRRKHSEFTNSLSGVGSIV